MSNIVLNPGALGATLGTDQVAGIDYQILKVSFSTAGVTPTQVDAANGLPVTILNASLAIVGTVTANAGTNLNTSLLSLESTQALVKAKTDNLDVALSTRLKSGDTLVGVTTVGAVTSITNALPAGGNTIGAVNINGTVPVSGSLSIAASPLPTVTQDDDKQYDDDGIPYVNPNVPGADIATGDKQSQQLIALQQIAAGVPVTSLPGVVISSGNVTVGNFPANQSVTVTNASLAVTGSLATTPSPLPTLVARDDAQYDDEGFPFVNTNVPGADIATGDRQQQQLDSLNRIATGVVITSIPSIAVNNLPANQSVTVTNASLAVTGSLATTAPVLPTLVARDDAQFDDDGFMYVNPNVPSADIATGDKQTQQLQVLQQIAAIVPASTLSVSNFPVSQSVTGSVQAYDNTLNDTLQAILLELRVVSNLISMQGQPNNLGPDVLRNDLQLYQ